MTNKQTEKIGTVFDLKNVKEAIAKAYEDGKQAGENCITPITLIHSVKLKSKITYDKKFKMWRISIK